MVTAAPTVDQVWSWLSEIEDPEIPVISIVDLGIVRDVRCHADEDGEQWEVTLTPTYSGCPATHVISQSVVEGLASRGVDRVRVSTRLSPAWTTDWLSDNGRQRLREYGIAPPVGLAAEQVIDISRLGRGGARARPAVPSGLACPRCGSADVELTSPHGSTPCKALYKCRCCLEPFDYFKCH
jgi:ring-1,2-phenylacetyl-CoA epoxidase subunit PaaD